MESLGDDELRRALLRRRWRKHLRGGRSEETLGRRGQFLVVVLDEIDTHCPACFR